MFSFRIFQECNANNSNSRGAESLHAKKPGKSFPSSKFTTPDYRLAMGLTSSSELWCG